MGEAGVVLVAGPALAGVSSMVRALRPRLPGHVVVEAGEVPEGAAPAAVVFVVSAVAPLTESDARLAEEVTRRTALPVGVVAKIDAHRGWRDVLSADRDLMARRHPRFAEMPWVGAAAAPDLGEPGLDEVVTLLRRALADPALAPRNRLRARESDLESQLGGDRVAALRRERARLLRDERRTAAEATVALRLQVQLARAELGHFARTRCTSVRAGLQADIATLRRRDVAALEPAITARVAGLTEEIDAEVTRRLADVAVRLGVDPPAASPGPPPPMPHVGQPVRRRLETLLMTVLGAGFGLGVAVVVARALSGTGSAVLGGAVGALVGAALTAWVVGVRTLLQHRAVLDRWVGDVLAGVRAAVDERVAGRLAAAEAALQRALAGRQEERAAAAAERVAEIDARLRRHVRTMASLQHELDGVRAQLYRSGERGSAVSESFL